MGLGTSIEAVPPAPYSQNVGSEALLNETCVTSTPIIPFSVGYTHVPMESFLVFFLRDEFMYIFFRVVKLIGVHSESVGYTPVTLLDVVRLALRVVTHTPP
jgi:hypothetical protein